MRPRAGMRRSTRNFSTIDPVLVAFINMVFVFVFSDMDHFKTN